MRNLSLAFVAVAAVAVSVPATAEAPDELLLSAAFSARDKATALARVDAALKATDALLARNRRDREAQLHRAVAISYRGKLKHSRSDLLAARSAFEALAEADPRDAEAQMALAGWHLGAVIELGPLVARTALGARKSVGLAALDKAVALGGGRAFFPAYASLTRIRVNPSEIAEARRLAEAAVKGGTPTLMDRVLQRQAAALLPALKSGNGKAAAEAAKKLMPFGRFD